MNATYRKNFAEIDWSKPIVREEKPVLDVKKSDLSAPNFVRDCMEPTQSQATGKMYTSKAALRAEYKELGMVEVGNDSSITNPKRKAKPKPNRKKIRESVDKAFSQAGLGA